MRRIVLWSCAPVLVVLALAGCAKKQSSVEMASSSDSLLASNPVEQPAGDITPQTQYSQPQTPPPAEEPPAPAEPKHKSQPKASAPAAAPARNPGVKVDAGTGINVSVGTQISSESANVGDTWTGEVKENVIVGDRVVFPAGSVVTGTVTEAVPAEKGKRARLGIEVTSITVNGTKHPVEAGTEAIEAGSTRARNLGAMAGGAAAGALIGRAVGGSGKGALIGGLLGGAAAGAGVAASKGYQVVLKEGTVVTFNVKQAVTVRS